MIVMMITVTKIYWILIMCQARYQKDLYMLYCYSLQNTMMQEKYSHILDQRSSENLNNMSQVTAD